MRTAIKLFVAVLAFTLSAVSFTPLNAQSIPKGDKYPVAPCQKVRVEPNTYSKRNIPAPDIYIGISVREVSIGVYNLQAYFRSAFESKRPYYVIRWYKDGRFISSDWDVSGVTYGHYLVMVKDLSSGKWDIETVNLMPASVNPGPSTRK